MKALYPWLAVGAALVFVGCSPKIGRQCSNSLDCSLQGSRICDRTQPHGYCTITGCEQGTCPDQSVCVKFRANEERLAVTYCMSTCNDSSNCRDSEGYRCLSADTFGAKGDAKILGKATQKFCALRFVPAQPSTEVALPDSGIIDAGMSVQPDAASSAQQAQADAAVQADAAAH